MARQILSILALVALAACGTRGSGALQTQVRPVTGFTAVALTGAADLTVAVLPGAPTEVVLETDDNLLPLIQTTVVGNTLTIATAQEIRPTRGLTVRVRVPVLTDVTLAGAGTVKVTGLQNRRFGLWLSGAGDVALAGDVTDAELHLGGAGHLDAAALHARNATLELGGAGDAQVFATEHADIRLAGAGHVVVSGHPKLIDKHIAGVGTVELK